MANKILPHNLEAEASILGAMLLSQDAIAVALEKLNANDFYSPAHGHIFKAIFDLYSKGEPVDVVSVSDEISNRGLSNNIGGMAKLVSIQNAAPSLSAASAAKYAKIVHTDSVARNLIRAGTEIVEAGFDAPGDISSALSRAESLIYGVSEQDTSSTTKPVAEVSSPSLASLRRAYQIGKPVTGVESGFEELDLMLAGFQPSALYVLGARPAMGKTALALNIASHAALNCGVPTLVFSLEMGEQELYKRLLASEGPVDSSQLKDGRLFDSDWLSISKAADRINGAPLFINDCAQLTIPEIRSEARRAKMTSDLGLVVVDYLQLMSGSSQNRQEEISEISRGLKILAKELEVPVIALSQLSRSLEARIDKRPMLSDLRESGSLEQDADVVFFVYRDEIYNDQSEWKGTAEIIVAKHRNGANGTVRLGYIGEWTKFIPLA